MRNATLCRYLTVLLFVGIVFSAFARQAVSEPPMPKKLSAYDQQIRPLLARMTLEEKIGQMTQPDQDALKSPSDIETYFVGSLLSGGNSDPEEGNSLKNWTDLYTRCHVKARDVLNEYHPEPVPDDVAARIRAIVEETDRAAGVG